MCAVADEGDRRQDRHDPEHQRHHRGQARDDRLAAHAAVTPYGAQHHQAVRERAHHDAHRALARGIAEHPVHHAGGVLARRRGDQQEGDRERDAGEGERRPGDGGEHGPGAVDGRREPLRKVAGGRIHGEHELGQEHPGHHEQQREEEQAAAGAVAQRAQSRLRLGPCPAHRTSFGAVRPHRRTANGWQSMLIDREARADPYFYDLSVSGGRRLLPARGADPSRGARRRPTSPVMASLGNAAEAGTTIAQREGPQPPVSWQGCGQDSLPGVDPRRRRPRRGPLCAPLPGPAERGIERARGRCTRWWVGSTVGAGRG